MSKCPVCLKEVTNLKTAIKNGVYVSERCERCLNSFIAGAVYIHQQERNAQKRHFAKDTIQRFEGNKVNPEFVRAYPEQAAREFGPEVLRGYTEQRKML